MRVISHDDNARFLVIGRSKGITIELPQPVKTVLVGDPKTVTVVLPTNRQAYIIGKEIGVSNIYFYDDNGRQVAAIDVNVNYGAPPHELQTYDQPATVVLVYQGAKPVRRYSCTTTVCVASHKPPAEEGGAETGGGGAGGADTGGAAGGK